MIGCALSILHVYDWPVAISDVLNVCGNKGYRLLHLVWLDAYVQKIKGNRQFTQSLS